MNTCTRSGKNRFYWITVIIILAIVSCSNPIHREYVTGRHSNTLTIELKSSTARTILPDGLNVEDFEYSLSLIPDEVGETYNQAALQHDAIMISDIAAGAYTLEVQAWTENRPALSSGPVPVTISIGFNSVSVQLFPLQENSGGLSLNAQWPSELIDDAVVYWSSDPAELQLAAPAYISDNLSIDTVNGELILLTSDDAIPSGTYYISIHLIHEGAAAARIIEAVQIYDFQLSGASFNIPAERISQPPAAPGSMSVEFIAENEFIVYWNDESNTEEGFRLYEEGIATAIADLPANSVETGIISSPSFTDNAIEVTYNLVSYNNFGESEPLSFSFRILADVEFGGFPRFMNGHPDWAAPTEPGSITWSTMIVGGGETRNLYLDTADISDIFSLPEPVAALGGPPYHLSALGPFTQTEIYNWRIENTDSNGNRVVYPVQEFTIRDGNLYVDAASVDGSGSMAFPFSSLAEARSTAEPGETIHITSGLYSEQPSAFNSNISIIGSYDSTAFTSRSLDPPGTIIAPTGGTASSTVISAAGAEIELDGLILRAGPGTSNTYVANLTGSDTHVTFRNSRLETTADTLSSINITAIRVAASGSLTLENSTVSLGGRIWNETNHLSASGIWILGENQLDIELINSEFITSGHPDDLESGVMRARSLEWISLANITGQRSINIEDVRFYGAITAENSAASATSAAINIGNAGPLNLNINNSLFQSIDIVEPANTHMRKAVRTGSAENVTIEGSIFIPANELEEQNFTWIDLNSVQNTILNGNKIRVPSMVNSGSAYGIFLNSPPTGAEALISNNVIEIAGPSEGLWSYGIRSDTPQTMIINNSLILAEDFSHTAVRLLNLLVGADNSVVANNMLVNNYTTARGLVNNQAVDVRFYANLFHNETDNIDALNQSVYGAGNFSMQPQLLSNLLIDDPDWYAPDPMNAPEFPLTAGVQSYASGDPGDLVPEDLVGISRSSDGYVSIGAYQLNGRETDRHTGPAGGWVFYRNPDYSTDGWLYLEADQQDIDTSSWSSPALDIPGAENQAIGAGLSNTEILYTELEAANQEVQAAQLAYTHSAAGFEDWFLPSALELQLMYNRLHINGIGEFQNTGYWSSTQYDADYADVITFNNGNLGSGGKTITSYYVRPVRRF